jgi:type III pantothenate kinase
MKNRIIVIDIGNTNLVIGLYDNDLLLSSWRIHTDKNRTEDEYFVVISSLLISIKEDIGNIAIAVLSSVVPQLNRVIRKMFEKYFDCKFVQVNSEMELNLKFLVADYSHVGADLLVNAYSSINKYQTNTIVCDLGTATTIQLTGKDGTFYGASIIPGVKSSSNLLFEKASQLADIKLERPKNILGQTTKDALLTGIINGHAFILDGFIRKIKEEYNLGEYKTIATGGIARLICSCSQEVEIIDDSLILDGLNLIGKNIK